MMACVASVVRVTAQVICGVVIRSVRNENGTGGSSAACCSRPSQSIEALLSRAGVPVLRRPSCSPNPYSRSGQLEGGGLAGAPGGDLLLAEVDQAIEECAGGQHHGAGGKAAAVAGDDAANPAVLDDQVLDPALDHLEIGGGADRRLHGLAIELAVGLGARALYGGALGAIEQPELDAGGVGDAAHKAVEGIDLAHQMALAEAADGRVAGHLADGREGMGDEGRAGAHAGRRGRSFAAGMAAAHNDHVELAVGHLAGIPGFRARPYLDAGPRIKGRAGWLTTRFT